MCNDEDDHEKMNDCTCFILTNLQKWFETLSNSIFIDYFW